MKLNNLLHQEMIPTLNSLLEKQLKAKTAFKMAKIINKINAELETYQSTRQTVMKKYAELDDTGSPKSDEKGMVIFKDTTSIQTFMKEMVELSQVDVDVGTISLEELGNIDMTTQQMLVLNDIITE